MNNFEKDRLIESMVNFYSDLQLMFNFMLENSSLNNHLTGKVGEYSFSLLVDRDNKYISQRIKH